MTERNQPMNQPSGLEAPIYVAPKLTLLGDVRDLTLGGSVGTGDSGTAGSQQF